MSNELTAICARSIQLLIGLYNFGTLNNLEKRDTIEVVRSYCHLDGLIFKYFSNGKIGFVLPDSPGIAMVGILDGKPLITKVTGNDWNVDLNSKAK